MICKDEIVNPKREKAKAVKDLRYALLKNPEGLSENRKAQVQFLVKVEPKLYHACLMKEDLRPALKAGPDEIVTALEKCMVWAQRYRIPVFRELRKKIKRHFIAIVAAARHHLSTARVEAINNKIKPAIRTANGFRNIDNMLLACSPVQPRLPGR